MSAWIPVCLIKLSSFRSNCSENLLIKIWGQTMLRTKKWEPFPSNFVIFYFFVWSLIAQSTSLRLGKLYSCLVVVAIVQFACLEANSAVTLHMWSPTYCNQSESVCADSSGLCNRGLDTTGCHLCSCVKAKQFITVSHCFSTNRLFVNWPHKPIEDRLHVIALLPSVFFKISDLTCFSGVFMTHVRATLHESWVMMLILMA